MIELQPLHQRHLPALALLADNPNISLTSSVLPSCTHTQAEQWLIETRAVPSHTLIYTIFQDHTIVGCCTLKRIDWQHRSGEISYWIGEKYWGKGYAHQAATLLVDIAFRTLALQRLDAHYLQNTNPASGRILGEIGFEADQNNDDYPAEGRFISLAPDVWTFVTLSRDKWAVLHQEKQLYRLVANI